MKRYRIILFDLDGTLVDSGVGITDSVAYALDKLGLPPAPREELYGFIGPPLMDSFTRFYGLSRERAGEAVDHYRSFYREKGVHENTVYPGITELLRSLDERGALCCLATSKPEVFANTVVDETGLRRYIKHVFAAELDDAEGRKRRLRSEKADVIEYALSFLGVKDRSTVLMVGDRKHDIEGAEACGVDSVGVTFGFGGREELEAAGASFIADSPEEILIIADQEDNL